MKYNKDTSEKILDSAIDIFQENGFNGTRMQAIADKAKINKSLLHYYFKSKDKLFQIIIEKAVKLFIPRVLKVINVEGDIFQMIRDFVSAYIDMLRKNPHIPSFIINEINNNPERLLKLLKTSGFNVDFVKVKIQEDIDKGIIRDISPEHLLLNTLSLCIFPFVAKPMVVGIILNGEEDKFEKLLDERKKVVANFIIDSIKI
ncbi:MAG: TetR/AcrR family transcriptional regulator [Bacteroidetes bacterium]|nr:MAG: TetR/AcrR family transcriptional regulator [Bacteroidota bacterium]